MAPKINKTVMPEYMKKISEYVMLGPHGIIPLNYVVEIDLAKDKAVLERIKNDPQFAERFQVSALKRVTAAELGEMKTGKVAITLKA